MPAATPAFIRKTLAAALRKTAEVIAKNEAREAEAVRKLSADAELAGYLAKSLAKNAEMGYGAGGSGDMQMSEACPHCSSRDAHRITKSDALCKGCGAGYRTGMGKSEPDPMMKAEGSKFSAGDTVRFKGSFLRNTGQVAGSEGRKKFTIVDHKDCSMCSGGRHVAVNEPDSYNEGHPRHIAAGNLEHTPGSKKFKLQADDHRNPVGKSEPRLYVKCKGCDEGKLLGSAHTCAKEVHDHQEAVNRARDAKTKKGEWDPDAKGNTPGVLPGDKPSKKQGGQSGEELETKKLGKAGDQGWDPVSKTYKKIKPLAGRYNKDHTITPTVPAGGMDWLGKPPPVKDPKSTTKAEFKDDELYPCPECDSAQDTGKDGKVAEHKDHEGNRCPGSGKHCRVPADHERDDGPGGPTAKSELRKDVAQVGNPRANDMPRRPVLPHVRAAADPTDHLKADKAAGGVSWLNSLTTKVKGAGNAGWEAARGSGPASPARAAATTGTRMSLGEKEDLDKAAMTARPNTTLPEAGSPKDEERKAKEHLNSSGLGKAAMQAPKNTGLPEVGSPKDDERKAKEQLNSRGLGKAAMPAAPGAGKAAAPMAPPAPAAPGSNATVKKATVAEANKELGSFRSIASRPASIPGTTAAPSFPTLANSKGGVAIAPKPGERK